MSIIIFEEKQRFNQLFLWIGIIAIASIFLYRFFEAGRGKEFILPAIVLSLVIALFLSIKLKTKIDEIGVHVQMLPFHLKPVIYKWEDLYSTEVVEYSPLREYGGWGVRISRNGKAFSIKGNKGIKIQTVNGSTRMIGTQKFDEAKIMVERFKDKIK